MTSRSRTELDSDLLILTQNLTHCINDGMDCSLGIAQNVAQHCEDDEALKKTTRGVLKTLIELEGEVQQYVQAINHMKTVGPQTGDAEDLSKLFEDTLRKAHTKTNIQAHPKYLAMEEELASVTNIEEQLESLRHTLVGSTQDEDVALTQTEVNIKCPYTAQVMVDPVRNVVCGHVYDKEGILGHIRAKRGKAKCPVGGCGNGQAIKESSLEEHRDMKRYISLLEKLKR